MVNGARGYRGAEPSLLSQSGGKGEIADLMLSTDILFSQFLLTLVLLSGSISLHSQEFMTCYEMQQWLGACLRKVALQFKF